MAITEFTEVKDKEPFRFKKSKKDDKRNNLTSWQYHNDPDSIWAKVSIDLLLSDQFQDLSMAARSFYLTLVVHKNSFDQSQCLFNALKEHFKLIGKSITDEELKHLCGDYSKSRKYSDLFVMPAVQIERYGYSLSYITKLKKELEDKGFIKVFANEKKRGKVDKVVTIYQFVNDWKTRKVKPREKKESEPADSILQPEYLDNSS